MKRSRKQREESAEEESEYEPVKWEEFVEANVVSQLMKVPAIPLEFSQFEELVKSWSYQYSVMWLSNVCSGYWTQNFTSGKAWWIDIVFDERIMLQDYSSGWTMEDLEEPEDNEAEEDGGMHNMFQSILIRLVRSLDQNKSASLRYWDEIVKYHVSNSKQNGYLKWYTEDKDCIFSTLSITQQFEIIFHVIKLIERKNIGFRNYLLNHLDNFQFPEIWEDDTTSLVILPTGKVIRKHVYTDSDGGSLQIPVKLHNCVLVERTEDTIELVHLDYSDEVESYLNDVMVEYTTITHDYMSFLEYLQTIEDTDFQEFFQGLLQYHAEAEVFGRKLYANKLKQQSMQALMVRRKRSSRLVAREEEHHKKEVETKWAEKLDGREHFLRHRARVVARRCKKLKDLLWSLMWEKFEKDSRAERLKRRTTTNIEDDETSNEIDSYVVANGESFKKWITNINEYDFRYNEIDSKEIPEEWCITSQDLSNLSKNDIPTDQYEVDSQDWYLDCICGKHAINDFKKVKDSKIVCCEKCLKWQHWDCQKQALIDILSQGHDHLLTPKELGAVTMYDENLRRRSSRRDDSADQPSHIDNRPTDRKHIDILEPFICVRCLHTLETELRSVFLPELKIIREKEKKKLQDKEKRRKIKEDKKKSIEVKPSPLTHLKTVPTLLTSVAPAKIDKKPQPAPWQKQESVATGSSILPTSSPVVVEQFENQPQNNGV